MKTLFYTLGSIAFAIFVLSFFFRGCDEQQKEEKIKEQHQFKLLTNANVFSIKDSGLPLFAQKLSGQSRYSVKLTGYDSLNVEEVEKYIYIDKPCFDTIKVGQTVDFLKFSKQAKLNVYNSIGDGYIYKIFAILLGLGVLVYGISVIYNKVNGR